jgi:hypothetical protein
MLDRPKTVEELFVFYDTYVKILYGSVQAENALPVEVLFEINAAFDHLSRAWIYGEAEADVVYKAHSHLKRSCLDIFKIRVKSILDQYNKLQEIDTSIIDNGDFDRKMLALAHEIKVEASAARKFEGRPASEAYEVPAFALWQPVFEKCERFEKEFFLHSKIDWAKKKHFKFTIREFILGVLTSALVTALFEDPLGEFLKWLWSLL